MKVVILFLALAVVSQSAPQQRKLFHEHYEDFSNLINAESGDEILNLLEQYVEYDEFLEAINYLVTPSFRNLIYEMEDLPSFKAVVDYLESHDVDFEYFINEVNSFVDSVQKRNIRNTTSGRDMASYTQDLIALFPKDKLIALYEEKIIENDEFRRAMESFETEEWKELYNALWQDETFLNEVAILKENGIDVEIMIHEYKAVLGKF